MRKLIAKVCFLLLLSMALVQPALAQGKQSQLEDYVCSQHGLQPHELVGAEFYQVHLEHTGLHLSVLHWATQGPDYRKGMAAWVEETGEYLVDDQVTALINEERLGIAKEYQELQAEAGKMDIGLYQELRQGHPQDEYQVYILPAFQLSQDLQRQIQDLYKEYGLEPPRDFQQGQILPWDNGSTGACEPAPPPQEPGSVSSGGGTDSCQPAIAPMPPQLTPAPAPVDPADDRVVPPDEPVSSEEMPREIYLPYPEEFYTALEQLHQQGYAQALSSLTEYLDSIGAAYTLENYLIAATLPAADIQNLAKREDVQWVGSFGSREAVADLPLVPANASDTNEITGELAAGRQDEAPSEGQFLGADSAPPAKHPAWFWAGGTLLGLLVLGAILIKK